MISGVFFNIRNNFTIRMGNPWLMPEFTDSYEVGSIFIYEQVSFNVIPYPRYTTDKIERVSTFEDNVYIFTPENIGTNRTTRLELNFKYSPGKKVTLNGDANYNYFKREGEFNDQLLVGGKRPGWSLKSGWSLLSSGGCSSRQSLLINRSAKSYGKTKI